MIMNEPYWYSGDRELAAVEYSKFRRCLPQLIDANEITGDLEGQWIIFKDGWVYGLAGYPAEREAVEFGRAMFRDEPRAVWIVVRVDLTSHKVSPLEMLSDALSDLEHAQGEE